MVPIYPVPLNNHGHPWQFLLEVINFCFSSPGSFQDLITRCSSIIQVSQAVLYRLLQALVEPVSLMVFSRCFGHLSWVVLSDVCNFCSQSCSKTAHLLCLTLNDVEELPHPHRDCTIHGLQLTKDDLQGTCPRLLIILVGDLSRTK